MLRSHSLTPNAPALFGRGIQRFRRFHLNASRSRPGPATCVAFRLFHPLVQRLARTADLGCDRQDRRSAGRVLRLVLQRYPHRPHANLRRKRARTCSLSCSSPLQPLRSWSVLQTLGGSVLEQAIRFNGSMGKPAPRMRKAAWLGRRGARARRCVTPSSSAGSRRAWRGRPGCSARAGPC